ncbi:KPN_02809 family neutral zinc metallopeptidase [Albibacterium profundi]|uniref:Neutral zinc metallopeptidase n=1 Tax=Albibacterium profundi TaxID=3134906 RepID=A0ABV5CGL5_9SPHI
MKWKGRRRSSNMEDRRGMSGGKMLLGGGVIGVVVLLVQMFTGTDLSQVIPPEMMQGGGQGTEQTVELTEKEKQMGEFVSVVLADTEDVWGKIFQENGMTYQNPKLVLFSNAVNTGCGGASAASGPFYCPADQTVYMDLVFFDELKSRFGAKGGDFAIAYVIAHEVGHHVQNLLGTSGETQRAMQSSSTEDANQLSVALELQADFYAGVWTHYNQDLNNMLEPGDIEEALSAANAVGDDTIQERMQGHANQETFTHGTSEQRMQWFTRGYETGDVNQGNTFQQLGLTR